MGRTLIIGAVALLLAGCPGRERVAPDACAGLRKQTITASEINRAKTDAETERSLREKVASNEYAESKGCFRAPRR